jgi:DNA primase
VIVNVVEVKEYLIENPDLVGDILNRIGCGKIKKFGDEFRCAVDKEPDSNATSIKVKLTTLGVVSFSDRLKFQGDIIGLVQKLMDKTFTDALKFVCDILGFEVSYEKIEKVLPFGGYYKGLKVYKDEVVELDTYPESILDDYRDKPNIRFLKDGISLQTQKLFKVKYDIFSERIIVPWRNCEGQIVGIMGRYNASTDECDKLGIAKWFPIIPFYKSQVLFGFSQNYEKIQEKKMIFVTESEKAPMQLHSMGINTGIAVGGHNISNVQAKYIKSCFPEKIIIAFDEDVTDENYLKEQCEKLTFKNYHECKVGYILDKEHKYLKEGGKESPTDKGKNVFLNLIKESIVWV